MNRSHHHSTTFDLGWIIRVGRTIVGAHAASTVGISPLSLERSPRRVYRLLCVYTLHNCALDRSIERPWFTEIYQNYQGFLIYFEVKPTIRNVYL